MATVTMGDPNVATAALFGTASHSTVNYVNNRAKEFMGIVSQSSKEIVDRFRRDFSEATSGHVSRAAQAVRNRVLGYFQDDSIRYLSSVGQIQNAPNKMVRWVMAHPGIRDYYHQGSVMGYGDRYEDVARDVSGPRHYDYRRVTNGMIIKNESGAYSATTYAERLHGSDIDLNVSQQSAILRTWMVLDEALEDGVIDPTSEWNDLIS